MDRLSINLADYGIQARGAQYGSSSQEEVAALNKALEATDITGRQTTNLTDASGAPLKVESLERTLKHLTFRESDIVLWKNLPKKADKGGLSLTTTGGSTAKNFHLMRVAELYLLYAEACIETGDINTAREYINKVRARAAQSCIMAADANNNMALTSSPYVLEDKVSGNTIANTAANYRIGLYPASGWTVDKAIKALRFERRIELAMEGHHWYDLVRWNAASEELGNKGSGFLAYEKRYLLKYQSATYPDRLVTLPIPNDEIVTMEGVLVQNENWK